MVKRAARRPPKGKGRKLSGKKQNVYGNTGPSMFMPPPGRKSYHFERRIAPSALAPAVADSGRSFNYTLSSFPGASEFTVLFDLYRMTSIEITITANIISTNQFFPILYFLADYDTYTTPSSIDVVMQRPHKRVALTAIAPSFTFKLKPRVLGVVQASSGTTSAALAPVSQWYDCNDSTIVYGGLLGWIENYNTVTGTSLYVTVRGQFDFAMVR